VANKKISQLTAVTTPLTGAEELPAVQSTVTKKVTVIELQAAPVSAGSANAVQYLNASKVPSTSTAFTFDGSSVSAPTAIVNSGFTGGRYEINFSSAAAASRTWKLQTDYSAFGALSVVTAATQGGAVTKEIVQFDSTGNANLYLGNLVISTAGKGIDFSANSGAAGMTSEVLTWYEEGAWTPNQGAGLTVVGAFSSSGKYTRTGRQMTVTGQVNGATSVLVSASGVISTNLPFTSGVNTLGVATNSALSVVGGVFVSSGTTTLSATVAIGATSTIYFQATYFV
jgi:hypothetical protein